MKDFKFKSYKFFTAIKNINFKRYKFPSFYNKINFRRYKFPNFYKGINFKKLNLSRVYNKINFRRYNFSAIYKKINLTRYRYFKIYAVSFLVILALIYLSIPLFFDYNKTKIEKMVCQGLDIECKIKGKINYSFFPSPRIKAENFLVKDFIKKNKNIAQVQNLVIKLTIYNLLNKEKFDFSKILLKNAEINFNYKDLAKYKKLYKKNIYPKSVNLVKGKIKFSEGDKYISTIDNATIKYRSNDKSTNTVLKGKFLNDKLYINLKSKKDKNSSKVFTLKLSNINLLTKIETFKSELDKETIGGKILLKKEKSKLAGVFDYKDSQIILKHINLRNSFLDGKLSGIVNFFPYFDFNLNSELNSVNFNKLYNILNALNEDDKKNLFKINEKINGQLNLSANKIFSKHTLIHSFESRIKFIYGDILLEQLLLNLGKLGAADVTGIIDNNKKFTNFKFETNIFLDNLKRFYNKFGIYNKEKKSSHLFVAGNLNLLRLKLLLSEISSDNEFTQEDIAYIQKEFNKIVLENGYASLFEFAKLKEFINLITN